MTTTSRIASDAPGRLSSRLAAALLLTTMLAALGVAGDTVAMRRVTDLRQEAELSRARGLVLVLEFSSDSCTYCRKLEALFLLPMQRNRYYDDKILVRSISLDALETVIDFDGRRVSTGKIASRYGVSLTPTLLFLGADGTELSERLVGIWSEDFYGGFIDARIDQARQNL